MIISPDGTRLIYVSHNRLLARRLDQPQATQLPGTEGAYGPFFSPDGQWVAFFDGNLKKVSVAGGAAAITLCNASIGFGGSWSEDGTIGQEVRSEIRLAPQAGLELGTFWLTVLVVFSEPETQARKGLLFSCLD